MSLYYQIYRSTTIGIALDDTLNELIDRQMLTLNIVNYILSIFDKIINEKLSYKIIKENSIHLKGHLLSYRSCDQVWTFIFDSLLITSNIDSLWKINLNGIQNKIKIITCPALKLNSINNHIKSKHLQKKF